MSAKGPPFNFFNILQQIGFSKSRKGPPFTILGVVGFFKMIIFCRKVRFSHHAISDFFKTGVFSM